MPKSSHALTAGEIAETSGSATTIEELCVICRVDQGWVSELIAHGVIVTRESANRQAEVSAATVLRVQKAARLVRDFDLNTPGVALALDLLDEIETLRSQLRAFSRARTPSNDREEE